MPARPVAELQKALDEHIRLHKKEPTLIMLSNHYVNANSFWFRTRLHKLCCGKGAIFNGIPCILTPSPTVEDFLISY